MPALAQPADASPADASPADASPADASPADASISDLPLVAFCTLCRKIVSLPGNPPETRALFLFRSTSGRRAGSVAMALHSPASNIGRGCRMSMGSSRCNRPSSYNMPYGSEIALILWCCLPCSR
jgi:hypothetical protein